MRFEATMSAWDVVFKWEILKGQVKRKVKSFLKRENSNITKFDVIKEEIDKENVEFWRKMKWLMVEEKENIV